MPFANTTPLRREIAARIPDRPFTVRFWDGTSLPATEGEGGPTFTVRSPRAAAHALAQTLAPGHPTSSTTANGLAPSRQKGNVVPINRQDDMAFGEFAGA